MLLLTHACDIARNAQQGTSHLRTMQPLYAAIPCLALPMNSATTLQNKFEMGRGYDFYFADGQDVKVGDQLTWNSDLYVASAVQRYIVPLVGYVHVMAKQEVD